MYKKLFVSYSRRQRQWVVERLKPCLEAGGATVLIDVERFKAGKAVVMQMDAEQDAADVNILVLTKDYLERGYCRHEMLRAVARDPGFQKGVVIPVRRDDAVWPEELSSPNPVFVDLREEADEGQWDMLLDACGVDLGTTAPEWLRARNDVVRWLGRKDSVHLVVAHGVKWEPLIKHLQETWIPDLRIIDLESPVTATRRGLLGEILRELGVTEELPKRPEDLPRFGRLFDNISVGFVALTHFDMVSRRRVEYDVDMFAAFRNLTMTRNQLVLLFVSHQSLRELLPSDYEFSPIDVKTTYLKERT